MRNRVPCITASKHANAQQNTKAHTPPSQARTCACRAAENSVSKHKNNTQNLLLHLKISRVNMFSWHSRRTHKQTHGRQTHVHTCRHTHTLTQTFTCQAHTRTHVRTRTYLSEFDGAMPGSKSTPTLLVRNNHSFLCVLCFDAFVCLLMGRMAQRGSCASFVRSAACCLLLVQAAVVCAPTHQALGACPC